MNEYNQSPEDDSREKPSPEDSTPPAAPGPGTPPPADSPTPIPAASPVPQAAAVPPAAPQPAGDLSASEIQSKKLASGLLGILVGGLGIHKFYLGYQQEGIVLLLVTVLVGGVGGFVTCGLLLPVAGVTWVIGLVEGILYLTKTDDEFANTYLRNKRPWF
jgi:TM2 domain-containing membrane protein YozV